MIQVKLLLDKGSDPNDTMDTGQTAFHFAAENGQMNVIDLLLKYGIKMTKSKNGMTPLIVAADRNNTHVVKFLASKDEVSKNEVIDAYELLGASYASYKDHYCLTKAYKYLYKAMKLRYNSFSSIFSI